MQKEKGSQLEAHKKNTKDLGENGRLTNKIINKLTNYYSLAVPGHSNNIDDMYNWN